MMQTELCTRVFMWTSLRGTAAQINILCCSAVLELLEKHKNCFCLFILQNKKNL